MYLTTDSFVVSVQISESYQPSGIEIQVCKTIVYFVKQAKYIEKGWVVLKVLIILLDSKETKKLLLFK